MNPTKKVTIIGAGLTGLSIAYFLREENIEVKILEARPRLGGRIQTVGTDEGKPQEMGATWLGKKHSSLRELLKKLDLKIFEQKLGTHAHYEPMSISPPQLVTLPPNQEPSFRIVGGTAKLIDKLASALQQKQFYLGEVVTAIHEKDSQLQVKSNHQQITSDVVVSTLPPYLFINTIDTHPALPPKLKSIANSTHTWMGDSIKISLSFDNPFWRRPGDSGTLFSNVGPIPELYDHSNYEDNFYCLKGFLNGSFYSVSKEERLEAILQQLEKYWGDAIHSYTDYKEVVWRHEKFTFLPYSDHVLPHQNNGVEIYRDTYLNNRLFIAGAETAPTHPGYMDGAVESARFIAAKIRKTL